MASLNASYPSVTLTATTGGITFDAEKSINLQSGTGIYFGKNSSSINKVSLNNVYIDGTVDLRGLELLGSMNTKMQTSIFNELNEEMINSKTSRTTGDQYGPVYGPVYGDVLGTVNAKGAFIGGDTGGYIGSTYNEVYESTLSQEFNPESIVNLDNFDSLESIPMNITKIDGNLNNFKVYSYNTASLVKKNPDVKDPYFGNLYNLTFDGKDDLNNTISNVLFSDQLNCRIQLSSSQNLNIIANISIAEFNKTYHFKDIIVNNVNLTNVTYINGNVNIGNTSVPNSNANLLNLTIDVNKSNLTGNFLFNYNHPSVVPSIQITGNIIRLNNNSLNKIIWNTYNAIEVQVANIDFPKNINGAVKFSNTGDNNILVNNSQLMVNTNVIYDGYGVYGNLIQNVYSRMSIYSNISGTITEITTNNKDTIVDGIQLKNLYGKLDYNANFNLLNNIFYQNNSTTSNYINTLLNNDVSNDYRTLLSSMDTWVRYVKPDYEYNYVRWPNGYGFTNNFTLNNYDGYTQDNIRKKSWYIKGFTNINGSNKWYLQSGIENTDDNTSYNQDNSPSNEGLNNNEATFLFLGPFNNEDIKLFNFSSTLSFHYEGGVNNWYDYKYDNLTVCYYDYNSADDDQNTKLELCKNIKPRTYSTFPNSFYPYETSGTLTNIKYLSDPSITEQDNDLSNFKNQTYTLPKLDNGMKRYIVFTYMKSWFESYKPDVFRLSNFSIIPNKTTYKYIDLSWNLKNKTNLYDNGINAMFSYSDDYVYLATGDSSITIPSNTSTYLLIGPISYRDFEKKYLYNAYLEFDYATVNYNSNASIELYKLESVTEIIDKKTIIDNANSVLLKTYLPPYNRYLYSSIKEIQIYDNLYDNKYKYFYFKYSSKNTISGMTLFNIKFKQYKRDDLTIPYGNININKFTSVITATISPVFMENFNLNYYYQTTQLTLDNPNLLNFTGKIVEDPLLSFNAIFSNVANVIQGNIFINGNGTFNQTSLNGRFIDGNLQKGNLLFINKLNYYNKNYYNYTWHSNLKYVNFEKLDTITQNKPFDGLSYKNLMLCGQMSVYNSNNQTFTSTPLFDNQLAILEYNFKPDDTTKKNFTINFKYQIFSEFRGDYFYFQYSIDNGLTYYNLLRQSGDISDTSSVALLDKYRWKDVSFYLPYNPIYKFRWAYKKDATLSSGYDTVFLADIFINYLNPIIQKKNNKIDIYADNFIGNISTAGSANDTIKDIKLPFLKKNQNPLYGFNNGDILINGTMVNYINASINVSSNLIYGNMRNFYRQTINYLNNEFITYPILSNTDLNVDKSWRLYDYNSLQSNISSYNWYSLAYDSTSDFINNSELALLSSQSKKNSIQNGLGGNDASIFTIGPIDYTDLKNNDHQLQFKYYKDSNEDSDLGIITYDYLFQNQNHDGIILNTLVNIVDLYNVNNHYLLQDLLEKYDPDNNLIKDNIISYPSNESGFTNVNDYKYGWRDVSIDLNKIGANKKRIIVFFFAKNNFLDYYNDDIVLIHNIKFTFQKLGESFRFTGFTPNTTTSAGNSKWSYYEYLNIDTPFGKRYIQLYTE